MKVRNQMNLGNLVKKSAKGTNRLSVAVPLLEFILINKIVRHF